MDFLTDLDVLFKYNAYVNVQHYMLKFLLLYVFIEFYLTIVQLYFSP